MESKPNKKVDAEKLKALKQEKTRKLEDGKIIRK
jgi:hypothetical protein